MQKRYQCGQEPEQELLRNNWNPASNSVRHLQNTPFPQGDCHPKRWDTPIRPILHPVAIWEALEMNQSLQLQAEEQLCLQGHHWSQPSDNTPICADRITAAATAGGQFYFLYGGHVQQRLIYTLTGTYLPNFSYRFYSLIYSDTFIHLPMGGWECRGMCACMLLSF